MHPALRKIIFLILSAAALVLFFQNCGDVKVNDSPSIPIVGTVEGSFCSGQTADDPATVLSFYVVNLNARVDRATGALEADSDADGLPDSVEENSTYAGLGYDSANRRSFGGLLDRLCSDQGSTLCDASGTVSNVAFGFNNLDLATFNFGAGAVPGINSDNDLIPDFPEYLFELDITRSDDDNYSDGDSMTLAEELKRGRSPVSPNDSFLAAAGYQYSNSYPDSSVTCPAGQTGYHFVIPQMNLVNTKSFSSVAEPNFNHENGVNLIGVFILSINGTNVKELQVGVMPLSSANPYASLSPTDFLSFR